MMLDLFTFKNFNTYSTLVHGVSTKTSLHPYDLSLAFHTGEEVENILSNRGTLRKQVTKNNSFNFVLAQQTHSDNIYVVKQKETRGWESMEDAIQNCDALITDIKGVMLAVLTADCVPILLYDKEKEVVAAIHAGWKGTKSNIAYKTVQKMTEHFGSNPKDIIAGIAPSIGSCCYEVSKDVADHFFAYPKSLTALKDKYMLDLPYLNKEQLIHAGLDEKNIEMSNICTACEVEKYFSYRKEQGCSGRFMSMIGLNDKEYIHED
jgi:YfiH family protein